MGHFEDLQNNIYNDSYFNGTSHSEKHYGLVPSHWSLTNKRWIATAANIAPWLSDKVLEVGCGRGTLVHHLRETHNKDVYGLDISPWAINNPISEAVKDKLTLGSLNNLTYPDNTYSGFIMFDVLEHIPYDYFDSTLEGIKRVCTDGAIVMGTLPTVDNVSLRTSEDGELEHYLSATREWWQSTLSDFLNEFSFIERDEYPFNMSPHNTFFIGRLDKET